MSNFYKNKKIFITGGAGFIGSHLADSLIRKGALVTIGDNLSTGNLNNVFRIWNKHEIAYKKTSVGYKTSGQHSFKFVDFQDYSSTLDTIKDHEIVFHLAANIGGRGYIETHPADCCEGFAINQNVIKAAYAVGVNRIQFASSACVYPQHLQENYNSPYLLHEDDVNIDGENNADLEYGWAKLMGEKILTAYHKQYNLQGSITRYVTAYGPWENDTHAVIALIKRALDKEDPFIIWGSGKQDRDFTYVDDIISGTLGACEKITDMQAINLGTSQRYTITQLAEMIFKLLNWKPKKIIYDTSKPEGVKTRALDNTRAYELFNWKPKYSLEKGLKETIDWYNKTQPVSIESLV